MAGANAGRPARRDLTPVVGAPTDVSPVGRSGVKPAHEQTAQEDRDMAAWDEVAAMTEFRQLVAAKIRFIVPATIFFLVYYLLLPLLVGLAPDLMKTKILGQVNLAYLFALSQFIMAWILAFIYLRQAGVFDDMVRGIIAKLRAARGGQ